MSAYPTVEERLAALEARVSAAEVLIATARFAPLGDNHHNAAACPYCGDLITEARRELAAQQAKAQRYVAALARIANSYPWEPYRDDETVTIPSLLDLTAQPTNRRIAREALAADSAAEAAGA